MRLLRLILLLLVASLAVLPLMAQDAGETGTPAGYGWLSLIPPLLAIGLALATRDVLTSLFLGVFGGALILYEWNPLTAFTRTIDHFVVQQIADEDHASILLFTVLLGGMVGLITKSGGTHGIVERLAPYATNSRRGQVATWFMGLVVFFDDYANTLIVGPTMRPITDKLRVSREKLAYIVDSTAAPVVCLFPISTWVGFEIGLINDAFKSLELPFNAYNAFVASIPYRFYPFFALVLGFTIAASRFDFGPMRAAERRARETGAVLAEDARPIAEYGSDEVEPPEDAPRRALNALIPIGVIVVLTLVGLFVTGRAGSDAAVLASAGPIDAMREIFGNANSYKALMWASLSGVIVAALLPISQGILKLHEAMTAMVGGFKAMIMAFAVLILAWSLGAVCGELKTADYLVSLTEGVVSPAWLPAITFVLSAAVAFATGSSWGTMSIVEPLVIPISHSLSLAAGLSIESEQYWTFMVASIASVLAGSVWGDHCSPISDTTILSSMATGCDHIAHVKTQIPYAMGAGLLGIFLGSILTAHGLSPWIALPVGASLIVGFVLGYGRYREKKEGVVEPA